jgi:hypothetical protein
MDNRNKRKLMKLSNKAIRAIDNTPTKLHLALALGFTEIWITRLIKKNKKDGPLTGATAVSVIKRETGLTAKEILEESLTNVKPSANIVSGSR